VSLKQIAFNLYDMNCDNYICEYDLFSFIKNSDNKLFIESINQDFKDIRKKMAVKSDEL
jgi:Ca2+-binding EF-hand superfamily protein